MTDAASGQQRRRSNVRVMHSTSVHQKTPAAASDGPSSRYRQKLAGTTTNASGVPSARAPISRQVKGGKTSGAVASRGACGRCP